MKFISALLFASLVASCAPVPAMAQTANDPKNNCESFDGIKKANDEFEPTWYDLTKDQDSTVRALFEAHEAPLPDVITTIKVGTTEKAPGIAFIFGFDKDGCYLGAVHMPIDDFHKALNSGS